MRFVPARLTLVAMLASLLAAALLCAGSAAAQHQNATLAGPGWQVIIADWGAGDRWMDAAKC